MATVLPAASVDPTKVVVGRQSIIQTKVATVTSVFLTEYLGDAGALDVGRAMLPGANNGPAFVSQTWAKSRTQVYKFRSKEPKKVIAAYGSLNFHIPVATATMFIRDPKDAANTVALLSEEDFACSIYRDPAEIAHSGDNPSEVTICIEAHKDGPVTLTPDGATQAPAG